MSKITLSPSASGTGTLTIASPNTNSDRTLTLPDSAGTIATAESTLAQFNASGDAPVYACRAWVNFNGTGTVAIRASGNVSSITDNGTGNYTVNFTTAMSDSNYSINATARNTSVGAVVPEAPGLSAPATTGFTLLCFRTSTATSTDADYISVSVFR